MILSIAARRSLRLAADRAAAFRTKLDDSVAVPVRRELTLRRRAQDSGAQGDKNCFPHGFSSRDFEAGNVKELA